VAENSHKKKQWYSGGKLRGVRKKGEETRKKKQGKRNKIKETR
jgi:hypothetical protein